MFPLHKHRNSNTDLSSQSTFLVFTGMPHCVLQCKKEPGMSVDLPIQLILTIKPFTVPAWSMIIDSILEPDFLFHFCVNQHQFISLNKSVSLGNIYCYTSLKKVLWHFSNYFPIKLKTKPWQNMLFAWATLFLENSAQKSRQWCCWWGKKALSQHQPFAYISHHFLTTRLLTVLEKSALSHFQACLH